MTRRVQRQALLPSLLAPSSSLPRALDLDEDEDIPGAFDPEDFARRRSESGAHATKTEKKLRAGRDRAIREQLLTLAEAIDADDWAQVEDVARSLGSWTMTDASWDRSALLAVFGVLEVLAHDMVAQTPTPPGEPELVEDDDDDDDERQLALFEDEDDDDGQLALFDEEG